MSANPLRPVTWADFIGQLDSVERLKIMVSAARSQGRTLDHVLLTGPPGLGKTTLAGIVANALTVELRTITSTAIPGPKELVEWLIDCLGNGPTVTFIDEIHRLNRETAETLLPAMEDYIVDSTLDGRAIRILLGPFTLIGATTRAGSLLAPLRDRFGIIERLKPYSDADLALIVARSARILDLQLPQSAIEEIARRSRGTPRVANRLVARVRDWTVHHGGLEDLNLALDTFGADRYGLDETGRLILAALGTQNRPVGMSTLSALVDEDPDTLEPLEAHLLRVGLIERTPRGRMITERGRKHAMEVKA